LVEVAEVEVVGVEVVGVGILVVVVEGVYELCSEMIASKTAHQNDFAARVKRFRFVVAIRGSLDLSLAKRRTCCAATRAGKLAAGCI
jgi:hypothetical protein